MDRTASSGLRVATWNLRGSGGADRVELMKDQDLDLLCGQEVTAGAFKQVMASKLFGWGTLSFEHHPRMLRGNGSERLGVAIFGADRHRLRSARVLNYLPRPEKFIAADVELEGWPRPVTVASYHASPGDGKPES